MNYFFYDGKCPFCSKTAIHFKSLCLSNEVEFVSFHIFNSEKLKSIHPDLNTDLLQGNIQFIYKGKRFPHFFAIRKLFFFLAGYRYLTPVLYLPLVPILGILVLTILKRRTGH